MITLSIRKINEINSVPLVSINAPSLKKAGYILFLIILILQSGGMLLICNVQQCRIQFQMAEKLKSDKSSFELITLTVNEYQKSRINSKEIRHSGKMYDVKSLTVQDGVVSLIVMNDNEEATILQTITNLVSHTNFPNSPLPNQLHQLISLVYIPVFSEHLLFTPSLCVNTFHPSKLKIASNDPEILSPPPKLA